MGDTTVMRAKSTGIVKGDPGSPRTIVTKGKSTAHAGHPIVTGHPHLWEPIRVDFKVEPDLFEQAAADAGLSHTEALRTLLTGLVDRGYSLPDPGDVPADEVAAMVVRIALNNLPEAGAAVNEAAGETHDDQTLTKVRAGLRRSIMGLAEDSETGIINAIMNEGILFRERSGPLAGDLRRTESGQLQEWGDGMWHDVQEAPAILPTGPDPDPISTPTGPLDTLGHNWDDRDRAELAGDAEAIPAAETPDRPAAAPADETTKEGRAVIRDWAGEHGYDVHPSGRIPQDIVDAYHADQG